MRGISAKLSQLQDSPVGNSSQQSPDAFHFSRIDPLSGSSGPVWLAWVGRADVYLNLRERDRKAEPQPHNQPRSEMGRRAHEKKKKRRPRSREVDRSTYVGSPRWGRPQHRVAPQRSRSRRSIASRKVDRAEVADRAEVDGDDRVEVDGDDRAEVDGDVETVEGFQRGMSEPALRSPASK